MLHPDKKIAGVLAPVFALRGTRDLGIGDTAALKEMVRWAASHGLKAVQILPVNETGSDNSPYNLLSSMALDPSTIATLPGDLPDLSREDFDHVVSSADLAGLTSGRVRYREVQALKTGLLRSAFLRFMNEADDARFDAYMAFRGTHQSWLAGYEIHRTLVHRHGSEVSDAWPEEHRNLSATRAWLASLPEAQREAFESDQAFYAYVQWIAFTQWAEVRTLCRELDVALIGDVPVGVSIYSTDVWLEPGIFDLERSSGAPPERNFTADPFTAKWGQNWGFPLYNWQVMSKDNFAWWRRRLRAMREMFDLIRVDHALGFFRIYSFPWRPEQNADFLDLTPEEASEKTGGKLPGFIPYDDEKPENCEKNQRLGEMLYRMFLEETGPNCMIAEDLGDVAPYVRPTLENLQIPGFKIPQWEREVDLSWAPGAEYPRLSLATYATHDHPPVRAFWNLWLAEIKTGTAEEAELAKAEMRRMMDFAGRSDLEIPRPFDTETHEATLVGLFSSNSWLAVPMITDLLATEDRFNVPGATGEENWSARLPVSADKLDAMFPVPLACVDRAVMKTRR